MISNAGDQCDSMFEVQVINDLLERGVSYDHHPDKIPYHRKVRGGFCLDCDSNNVRKGALYQADLYLPLSGVYVELKGGTMSQDSRSRLRDVVRSGTTLYFLFRQDRKLNKVSKTRYAKWADQLKCPYHIGMTIPPGWTGDMR
jgi:hypothetical protein